MSFLQIWKRLGVSALVFSVFLLLVLYNLVKQVSFCLKFISRRILFVIADESCKTWSDCMKDGKKCDGIQDVGCICKNGQCKISCK